MALDPQQLARAVTCWLEYEAAIGREDLFDESYLAYPIGAFLQARSGSKVVPEAIHPVLASAGRGRKPSVDFVVTAGDIWEWAIETKFINDARDFADELFADILRLECLIERFPAVRRLLVAAGPGTQMKALLLDRSGQTGGGSAPLFPPVLSTTLPAVPLNVELAASVEPQRGFWKGNQLGARLWPSPITTHLVGCSGDVSDGSHYTCLVWEIRSAQRALMPIP